MNCDTSCNRCRDVPATVERLYKLCLLYTSIHTKNNRKYKEYKDENAPLADIQTLVDGDKRSVIGEAIYEKSFKEVKLSGGARHYQMRTENEYKGSNPTTSKMDQSQTSAFFEVQDKEFVNC